jgi:hypothetical protein
MEDFTRLERDVVTAIRQENPAISDLLGRLLSTARVSDRNNTGVGFYMSFTVDRSEPPIVWPRRWVDGPRFSVYAGEKGFPMAFILWLDNGYPACIEGYTDGPVFDEQADIDLTGLDLATLVRWAGPS